MVIKMIVPQDDFEREVLNISSSYLSDKEKEKVIIARWKHKNEKKALNKGAKLLPPAPAQE
jgi:hypothetical protein